MSIVDQLHHKFIISIEGNDVATNLKWIMSSNSLCFAAKPKFETWYMEGRLIADHHFVQVADDYSNVEEKMAYYLAHPQEAEAIIANAHLFVDGQLPKFSVKERLSLSPFKLSLILY